ncbi:MAG: hypothetical protein L0211_01795 [Planctomycetaceae bacterium]|nr:hypothetical protein [Planctomycetaceae bacterium]
MKKIPLVTLALTLAVLAGCHHGGRCQDDCGPGGYGRRHGKYANLPQVDRPFPIGQVTDSFWETQQTNAEAADFIFYDHEFRGNTAELAPGAKKHLEQVALRLEHVPFPVVIEESPHDARPDLDQARRRTIVEQLARLGVVNAEERVIVANAFPEGYTAQEAEAAYYGGVLNNGYEGFGGGVGRRFGGYGGVYR